MSSSSSSGSDSDKEEILDRVKQRRRKQRVERDDSDDDANDLQRRTSGNKASRRHRGRAQRHRNTSSEDDSSGSDSDSKAIMKKRQPAARDGISKAKSSAERRKKLQALAKKRKKGQKNSAGGNSTTTSFNTTDLAFEIDQEDLTSNAILTLEERTDFFKMQGSGLGLDDASPLLSVNDFGLSVETVVQDAQDSAAARGSSGSSSSGGGGGGGSGGGSASGSSSNRARKAWVYVENMATGRFKRVHMGRLGYSRLVDNDADEDGSERSLTGPDLMDNATHSITALVAGVFQFAQGLLAGLALLHLFLVSSITAFGTFTTVYQPLSNESRRLYFILASLGLSSAIETFLRERENKELWNTLSPMQKIRILMCCFLYFVACGFSLLMMPTDSQISTDPASVSTAALSVWNTFEYIR